MRQLFMFVCVGWGVVSFSANGQAAPQTPVGQVIRIIGEPYLFRSAKKQPNTAKELQKVYKGNFKKRKDWDVYFLKRGTQLYENDVIVTRKNQKAHLLLSDRSVVTIDENSKLRIQRPEDKSSNIVNIIKGTFRAIISPKRTTSKPVYRSRSAVMGVRGTDFVATYDKGRTQVWTISGQVSLRARGADPSTAVLIGPGQRAYLDDMPPRSTLRKKKNELEENEWEEYISQYQPTPPKDVPPKRLDQVKAFTGPLYEGHKDMMNLIAEAAVAETPKQENFSEELASELDDDGTEAVDQEEDDEEQQQTADDAPDRMQADPEYGDSRALDGAAVFLAAIPGCGLGHALQGRWSEAGWKFTGLDFLATAVGSAILGDKNSDDITRALIVSAVLGVKGWQVYDVYSHSALADNASHSQKGGLNIAVAPTWHRDGWGALFQLSLTTGTP